MGKSLINPYTVGPPVMGGSFYGRDKLLSQVGRSLRSTNVVLLQGQRRIGKTSFLKQLAHFLSHEQPELNSLSLRVPVLFDIQRYVQDTLPQFQRHLAAAIKRTLDPLIDAPLAIPEVEEWEADSTLFQDTWLPQAYDQLRNQEELVILVDEFDNFDENIAPHAMQTLIPFLGQLASGGSGLKWVFTLGRLTGKVSLGYDPIVKSGEEFHLTFLTLDEARQMIIEPAEEILTYQQEAINHIYRLTKGQPHLTQAICSKIFEYLLDEDQAVVTVEIVNTVIPQTLEAYGSAIASIVSVPPIEERVLAAVAILTENKKTTNRDEIIQSLLDNSVQISIDELDSTLSSLVKWELLERPNSRVSIAVELVRIWIAEHLVLNPSQEEALDIQYALAQSHLDLAKKVFEAGQYDLAIGYFKETLRHIPNCVEALKGIVKSYWLTNKMQERAEALQELYLYESNVLDELIEARLSHAEYSEKDGLFLVAAQQYEALNKIEQNEVWQRNSLRMLAKFMAQASIWVKNSGNFSESQIEPRELQGRMLSEVKLILSEVRRKFEFQQALSVNSDEDISLIEESLELLESLDKILDIKTKLKEAEYIGGILEAGKLLSKLDNLGAQLSGNEKRVMIASAFLNLLSGIVGILLVIGIPISIICAIFVGTGKVLITLFYGFSIVFLSTCLIFISSEFLIPKLNSFLFERSRSILKIFIQENGQHQ